MTTSASDTVGQGPRFFGAAKRYRALIAVTGELGELIRANAPLVDGLLAVAVDAPNSRIQALLLAIREDLAAGMSLHDALRKRPSFFPQFYTDLVKSGEETGKLPEAFRDLEESLLHMLAFRVKVREYLGYVFGVLLVDMWMMAGTTVFVVPQFENIFREFGSEVPASTRTLLAISNVVRSTPFGLLFATVCAGVILLWFKGFTLVKKGGPLNEAVGRLLLGVPFLRSIVAKRNLAHAAAVLEKLLGGGIPLDLALAHAASLEVNELYAAAFGRLRVKIQQGESLTTAMEHERHLLPASFRGLVSLGENSGLLPEALGRIAELYRRESLKAARILADITSPIALCFVGALVMFVYVALFSPIVGLSTVVINAF